VSAQPDGSESSTHDRLIPKGEVVADVPAKSPVWTRASDAFLPSTHPRQQIPMPMASRR
jgi:hypothetical protein